MSTMFSSVVSIRASGSTLLRELPRKPTSNVRSCEMLTVSWLWMGYGRRHWKPACAVLLYLPNCVTTATWPSWTMKKPLASHSRTSTRAMMPRPMRVPRGDGGVMPPRLPGRLLPPPPLRPNSEPMRLLKSRQTSSRSGGPSPLPFGRLGGSEPLLLPRPQPGSFRLKILVIRGIVSHNLADLCNCPAQRIQTGALGSAYEYSRNRTMGVTLDPRGQARPVDLVVHQNGGNRPGPDLGQHLLDLGDLFVALRAGGIHHVQQHVGVDGFLEGGAESGDQVGGQVPDETHGVRQHHRPGAFDPDAARGGVQRGEELVGRVGS